MINALSQAARRWLTVPNLLFGWHLWLTAIVAWWAFVLALPVCTFCVSRSYDRFAAITPNEQFWAIAFFVPTVIGILGCWSAWPPRVARQAADHPGLRMFSVVVLAAVHGTIAVMMFRGADAGTGPGMYGLVMCNAYILLGIEYVRS